ncbi:MAG: hypothetical protein AB1487_04130 [Thermodesulfobacteriota bacterium]
MDGKRRPSPQPSPNGRGGSASDVEPSPSGRGQGEGDCLKTIDLGAGHSSGSETLCGRVITALKSQALLNESVGAGYIERNWPPALKDSGAWPLASLRQSFLNGSLTRLLDPDTILRNKIVELVSRGDFGLASGRNPDGGYERVLFNEFTDPADVTFEPGVFLLLKAKAMGFKSTPEPIPGGGGKPVPTPEPVPPPGPSPQPEPEPPARHSHKDRSDSRRCPARNLESAGNQDSAQVAEWLRHQDRHRVLGDCRWATRETS